MSSERRLEEIFMEASMSPKKDEYMRGYGDGWKDAAPEMLFALRAEAEADQAQEAFENACGTPDDGSDDRVDNLGAFALELRQRARELRQAIISKVEGRAIPSPADERRQP